MATTCESWADLLPELLSLIVDDLGLVDLLSFRGVCKSWRAVASSSGATAQVESSPDRYPWLLVHGDANPQCLVLNARKEKRYMSIPELDHGATCITSYQGWLLVANQNSVFFLCPLSRARIDLPDLPVKISDLSDSVAAVSAPPTSNSCIVTILNRKNPGLEVLTLSRASGRWESRAPGFSVAGFGGIKLATFHEGKFYFRDEKRCVSFCPKGKKWGKGRSIRPRMVGNPVALGFSRRRIGGFMRDIWDWFGSESGVAVSACGTMVRFNLYIPNEIVDSEPTLAPVLGQSGFILDFTSSLSVRAGRFQVSFSSCLVGRFLFFSCEIEFLVSLF